LQHCFALYSSSALIQGLCHSPVPASINPTSCVVYQDLFFLWACTKESASALALYSFVSKLIFNFYNEYRTYGEELSEEIGTKRGVISISAT
jgi:hypothetical protein